MFCSKAAGVPCLGLRSPGTLSLLAHRGEFFPHRQMDMIVLETLERINDPLGLSTVEVCDSLCRRAAQVSAPCASVEDVRIQPGLLLLRGLVTHFAFVEG